MHTLTERPWSLTEKGLFWVEGETMVVEEERGGRSFLSWLKTLCLPVSKLPLPLGPSASALGFLWGCQCGQGLQSWAGWRLWACLALLSLSTLSGV